MHIMNEFIDPLKTNIDQTTLVRAETISLKEVEDLRLADGSLLMKWRQINSVSGRDATRLDYATAIMPGYKNIRNLPLEEAWNIFNYKNSGEDGQQLMVQHINKDSPTLLLPLQAGVCPFDCQGCSFARNSEGNEDKKVKMIGVEETRVLIQQSLEQAKKRGIDDSNIGISFVGSGDATPNPFLEKIFQMIRTEFPNVKRVRFSTIAGNVPESRSTPMQAVAKVISSPEYNGRPSISMQVSVHNTSEEKRAAHVYNQKLKKEGTKFTIEDAKRKLLPLSEVAKQFEKIVEAQRKRGFEPIRKPTLTFVCTNNTEISVESLGEHGFKPETTVIQLRPILSDNPADSMNRETFSTLYDNLRNAGYDVVLMPVTPSGVELKTG